MYDLGEYQAGTDRGEYIRGTSTGRVTRLRIQCFPQRPKLVSDPPTPTVHGVLQRRQHTGHKRSAAAQADVRGSKGRGQQTACAQARRWWGVPATLDFRW